MLSAQSRFRRRSLTWMGWLLPLWGLLLIGFMWALVLHNLAAERERVVADAFAKARGLNRAFEEYTQRAFGQVEQVTAFVGYSVEHFGHQVDLPGLLRQGLAQQPGLIGIYLADPQGRVVASTAGGIGTDLSDREHFQVHVDGRRPGLFISKPVFGRVSQTWAIQFSRRLQAPDGSFAGVVVVSADPAFFTRFYDPQQHGREGVITLLGLDGTVRARRSGDRLWFGEKAGVSVSRELKRAPEGTYRAASSLDAVMRLIAYHQLPDRPFVVVTGLAEDEVLAEHLARRRTQLGIAALASAVVMLAFGALSLLALRLRRSEIRRHIADRRLRDITDNLPALIAYIDTAERFQFCNATYRDWLGMEPSALVGRPVAEAIGPALYAPRREAVARALAGERVEFDVETPIQGRTRVLHNAYIPDRAADGRVRGLYALCADVTELKAVERQLSVLARSDPLTGLPNRHALNECLVAALARAERSGDLLALMFLDVDHFKRINDRLGHAGGDQVLKEFAGRLRTCVRATDTVARLGGDEFVIVLEGLGSDVEPAAVAQKIVTQMHRPFALDHGETLEVTTSIGIALHRHGRLDADELLGRADAALYGAKTAGRNTFQLSTQ